MSHEYLAHEPKESETPMVSDQFFYIAGPMSGIENHNRFEFEVAEKTLRDRGVPAGNIFNPIDHEASLMVQKGLIQGKDAYRICMKKDLDWICDWATNIYMLQGWENSKGAKTEWQLAVALGLEIEYQ